jgi:hypothetical protein
MVAAFILAVSRDIGRSWGLFVLKMQCTSSLPGRSLRRPPAAWSGGPWKAFIISPTPPTEACSYLLIPVSRALRTLHKNTRREEEKGGRKGRSEIQLGAVIITPLEWETGSLAYCQQKTNWHDLSFPYHALLCACSFLIPAELCVFGLFFS